MSPLYDVPEIRTRAVERRRLLHRLEGDDRLAPLVVLHGQAGSGKSTLLAQWARSLDLGDEDLLWISMHQEDAGIRPFWNRVSSALADNGLGARHPLLSSVALHGAGGGDMSSILRRDRGAHGIPMTLVLDDYHLVSGDALDSQLRQLLESDHRLRLVIGSRTTNGLHSIDLAARVHTVLLDADALAFTLEESELLVSTSEVRGDESLARVIHQATGGWPLASQALLVEAQRDPSSRRLIAGLEGGTPRFIDEFVRAALASRSSASQDFLLRIALADECTVRLAEELGGLPADVAVDLLDELERDGIGTWQERSGVAWFRMHPLMQEAFEVEATTTLEPAVSARLCGLLAQRLEYTRPLRSLELAHRIGDWNLMEGIAVRHWLYFSYYQRDPYTRLLRSVPREAMREHPALLGAELVQDYADPMVAPARLIDMFRVMRAQARRSVTHDVTGVVSELMFMGVYRLFGELGEASNWSEHAHATLAETSLSDRQLNAASIPIVHAQSAITSMLDGQYSRALEHAGRARTSALDAGSIGERFQGLAITAFVYAAQGDIASARQWIESCEQADPYDGWLGGYLQAGYHLAKGASALNDWNGQGAFEALSTLEATEPVIEFWPYIAVARAYADLLSFGPNTAHDRLLATLDRKTRRPPIPAPLRGLLVAVTAEMLILDGQQMRAADVVVDSGITDSPDVDLVRAHLAAMSGNHLTAVALADKVLWASTESPRLRSTAFLTTASAFLDAGQPDRAVDAFANAMSVLSRNSLRLPLLALAPSRIADLLALVHVYDRTVDEAVVHGMPDLVRSTHPIQPLSAAERRVLRALRDLGDVRRAAGDLHLSEHTVRYHLKRAYRKLGLSARTDAIALAQHLGMLND